MIIYVTELSPPYPIHFYQGNFPCEHVYECLLYYLVEEFPPHNLLILTLEYLDVCLYIRQFFIKGEKVEGSELTCVCKIVAFIMGFMV